MKSSLLHWACLDAPTSPLMFSAYQIFFSLFLLRSCSGREIDSCLFDEDKAVRCESLSFTGLSLKRMALASKEKLIVLLNHPVGPEPHAGKP